MFRHYYAKSGDTHAKLHLKKNTAVYSVYLQLCSRYAQRIKLPHPKKTHCVAITNKLSVRLGEKPLIIPITMTNP